MHNQYLQEVTQNDLLRNIFSYQDRDRYVAEYSWAIPTEEAVKAIAKFSPLVEAGAGTGYWAFLINQAGADIIAYDANPPAHTDNKYRHKKQYFNIQQGGAEKMSLHADRSLFLCWPPYSNSMGYEHLAAWSGKDLILIAEDRYGCCGDKDMWDHIENNFSLIEEIYIPQWYGIHDYLQIYSRKLSQ